MQSTIHLILSRDAKHRESKDAGRYRERELRRHSPGMSLALTGLAPIWASGRHLLEPRREILDHMVDVGCVGLGLGPVGNHASLLLK